MSIYLYMDGVDDYLSTPQITADRIALKFGTVSSIPNDYMYLFDNRNGTPDVNSMVYINKSSISLSVGSGIKSYTINGNPGQSDINLNTQYILDAVFAEPITSNSDGIEFATDYIKRSGYSFNGNFYDIKIYNAGTLVAHYDMSTGTVQDKSGNGNHATLYGGTWKTTDTGSTPVDSGPITLSASGAQSAQSTRLRGAQANMAGDSDLTAQPIRVLPGVSDLSAANDMQAQAIRQINESAALQGTSTLTAQAGNVTIITGSVNMSATSSIAAKANRIVNKHVDINGASDLTASPTRVISSASDLNAVSDLSAQATAIIAIDADLVAQEAMQAVIGAELIGTIELEGQRELHVYLIGKRELNVNLKGVI